MLSKENQFALLQPRGRLDAGSSVKLQEQIEAIVPDACTLWLIDLAQVDFIDSSGLVALIAALNRARQHRCYLAVCNLRPAVKLIFEITRLDQAFEIFDSQTAALNTICPSATATLPAISQRIAA